jgi:cephalosporin hydroxylase
VEVIFLMEGENPIVDQFHQLYYNSNVWMQTYWRGVPVQKCPLDLWMYQEIMNEVQPDLIIECGTAAGGSAYYLASICDMFLRGRIISIDIQDHPARPQHPRITYLTGSSVSAEIYQQVRNSIQPGEKVMVILDSDHHFGHVLNELRIYALLVSPGSYMIVEDTNINGHPVFPSYGPGPMEAVQQFLAENNGFTVDRSREKLMLTFFPHGFLKKL